MAPMIYKKLKIKGLVDTHTHINAKQFDLDRKQVIDKAEKNKIEQIWDVANDITSSHLSLDISTTYSKTVKSWIGIEPEVFVPRSDLFIDQTVNDDWINAQEEQLKKLIESHRQYIIGIGETGLDRYWLEEQFRKNELTKEEIEESFEIQKKVFALHINLAKEYDLPLTIHSRGAEEECIKMVKKHKEITGIFHSYTGDYDTAKKILDLGFGLGVNGIATFRNAYELRNVYSKILGKVSNDWSPEDFYKKGIFFETDAPFLSPEGKRGQRNEPANIKDIFQLFVSSLTS